VPRGSLLIGYRPGMAAAPNNLGLQRPTAHNPSLSLPNLSKDKNHILIIINHD
jgi:hypothetical protein